MYRRASHKTYVFTSLVDVNEIYPKTVNLNCLTIQFCLFYFMVVKFGGFKIVHTRFLRSILGVRLSNKHNRSTFIKYRTTNHKLPVGVERWENIPRIDRICPLCNDGVADEYHYLFQCMFFKKATCKYTPKYYFIRSNTIKCRELFCTKNVKLLNIICKFLDCVLNTFKIPR